MKKLKCIFRLFVLILFIFPVNGNAGESAEDTAIAQQIRVGVIEPTLFSHKICANTSDCDRRAVIRFSVAGHISWRIHAMTDREIITDVFSRMLEFTKKLPRNKTYAIYVYREKEEDVGFFAKPIAYSGST